MDFSPKKRRKRHLIDISPLIDVVFLLLIFFMVSTTFLDQPGIPLELPQTVSHVQKKNMDITKVLIDANDNIYFSGEKIDLITLGEKINEAFSKTGKRELYIEADKDSKHGTVIKVMDTAKTKGAKSITIVTKQKKRNEKRE